MARRKRLAVRLRRQLGTFAVDNFFRAAALVGKLHPQAAPHKHGVDVRRDIPYSDEDRPEHRLDIYRPRDAPEPLPVVLYVHGGGFRILSKDTHWVMGLAFARAGYLVFNISYRLAPQHRFPAALQDCAAALAWLHEHAAALGGDLDRLVVAGESAGANLVSALTVMSCYRRPEPWARRIFDLELVPRAFMPSCGMLQVSDPERFRRRKPLLGEFLNDRLLEVSGSYLGPDPSVFGETLDLADPLLVFERGAAPDRPLPPCFASVGTADPLLDDTRRLKAAIDALGGHCEAAYYPDQVHAFQAMVWTEAAKSYWRDSYRFLEEHVGG